VIAEDDDYLSALARRFALQFLEVADDLQQSGPRSVTSPSWTRIVLPPDQ
jgi:hypothetical protein